MANDLGTSREYVFNRAMNTWLGNRLMTRGIKQGEDVIPAIKTIATSCWLTGSGKQSFPPLRSHSVFSLCSHLGSHVGSHLGSLLRLLFTLHYTVSFPVDIHYTLYIATYTYTYTLYLCCCLHVQLLCICLCFTLVLLATFTLLKILLHCT